MGSHIFLKDTHKVVNEKEMLFLIPRLEHYVFFFKKKLLSKDGRLSCHTQEVS